MYSPAPDREKPQYEKRKRSRYSYQKVGCQDVKLNGYANFVPPYYFFRVYNLY